MSAVQRFPVGLVGLGAGIRFGDAGVHGKAFGLDEAGVHATTRHFIEPPATQTIAHAE